MKKANVLLAVLLVVSLGMATSVYAVNIEGAYSARGTNPGEKGSYTGTAVISKTGDTYKVVWSVGTAYVGTGIIVGDVLSVAYIDENKTWFGVVAYKVLDGGKKLEGLWCAHNGKVLGTETLVKK